MTLDPTLTRIAHDQAQAMAAKDQLDHDVLGRFNSRVGPAGAGRAAENIAYGYDSFPKTLDQWINSSGIEKTCCCPAPSRVGVASVKSAKTGRMYWAMVIAGDYERPKPAKSSPKRCPEGIEAGESHEAQIARGGILPAEILSLCL